MLPVKAKFATQGAHYVTQKGITVTVVRQDGDLVMLRRIDSGAEMAVNHDHLLTPSAPVDADTDTSIVGKPRTVIEAQIGLISDSALTELAELDTRLFVEVLVAAEQARRKAFHHTAPPSDAFRHFGAPPVAPPIRAVIPFAPLPDGTTNTPDAAGARYVGAHDDALLAHAEEAIAEMNARAAEEAAEEAEATAAAQAGAAPVGIAGGDISGAITPEPATKRFPRGVCPVCGHEGMLTAAGKVRAHQHAGSPCQGQLALTAAPAALSAPEPTVVEHLVEMPVTIPVDLTAAADLSDPAVPRFDDNGEPALQSVAAMRAITPPDPAPSIPSLLATLAREMPHYIRAREAIVALRRLGINVDIDHDQLVADACAVSQGAVP